MKEKRKRKIKGGERKRGGKWRGGKEDKIGRNEGRSEEGKAYGGRGEKQGGPGTPVITCRDSRPAGALRASSPCFLFSGRITR